MSCLGALRGHFKSKRAKIVKFGQAVRLELSWPSQVLLASCSAKAAANAAAPPSKLNQGPRQQRQMFAASSFPPSNSHCFVTGELSLFAAQMSGVAATAPHCASNTATSRPQVVHIPAIHPPTGGPAAATPINTCPTSKRLFLTVCESDIRSAQLGWGGLAAV